MSTYTPKVGDTVRLPASDEGEIRVTAVGEASFLGRNAIGYEAMYTLTPSGDRSWVKVEPTPADTFMIFDSTGEYTDEYATAEEAHAYVERHKDDEFVPFRVARFSFVEWVEAAVVPGE